MLSTDKIEQSLEVSGVAYFCPALHSMASMRLQVVLLCGSSLLSFAHCFFQN